MGFSKILLNIKYLKHKNAFLKEVKITTKTVIPKLFHSGVWVPHSCRKTCRKNFGPPERAPPKSRGTASMSSLQSPQILKTTVGQSQSSHGCFPNQFSINCAPWKSTVSSALDFQVRTPFLTDRVAWDQCCLRLEFYVSYNPFAVVGPVLFLHLLMNIGIYISLIYVFHFS